MRFKSTLIILLSFFTLNSYAQQKIALLEPRVGDGSTAVTSMEKAMIRGELRKVIVNFNGFEAITRTDIDQMMREQNFQRTGMVSDAQIKKLGEMSGADYICVSTLTKSNTEFYLEAYLIHLETGTMSNPASQYGELMDGKLANMLPVCQALAQELLGAQSTSNSTLRIKRDYTESAFGINMKMVWVEGGDFMMGCTSEQSDCRHDEKNVRKITLDGFYMGVLEVTQAQWEKVMGVNIVGHYKEMYEEYMYILEEDVEGWGKIGDTVFPSPFWNPIDNQPNAIGPNYPMYGVSRSEAIDFCRKLSEKTGKKYTLPTEAQWEYAARGGQQSNGSKYAGDNVIGNVAWYVGNSHKTPHFCGTLRPNPLGLFDMSGNVAEWCMDLYADPYLSYDTNNPTGPQEDDGITDDFFKSTVVIRGGGYIDDAVDCRISSREEVDRILYLNWLGFRVVCVP